MASLEIQRAMLMFHIGRSRHGNTGACSDLASFPNERASPDMRNAAKQPSPLRGGTPAWAIERVRLALVGRIGGSATLPGSSPCTHNEAAGRTPEPVQDCSSVNKVPHQRKCTSE